MLCVLQEKAQLMFGELTKLPLNCDNSSTTVAVALLKNCKCLIGEAVPFAQEMIRKIKVNSALEVKAQFSLFTN